MAPNPDEPHFEWNVPEESPEHSGSEHLRPGTLLAGSYRLGSEIARGGMGAVYRGREKRTGRDVAIKLILKKLDGKNRERFLREGQITASFDHPGIVKVHACGEHEGRLYLVYELVQGCRTLNEAFRLVTLPERVRLVRDAALALGYVHQRGVVHRDVKPENLLVDDAWQVRIADFGLASTETAERLTQTGELLGTPAYMAPEQLSGAVGRATAPSDVWALGVILYEALTKTSPFTAASLLEHIAQVQSGRVQAPRKVSPDVTPALEAVCLRALSGDAALRFPDGAALAEALTQALERKTRDAHSRRTAALCLGAAALVATAFAVAQAIRPGEPPPPAPLAGPTVPPPAEPGEPSPVGRGPSIADALLQPDPERRLAALEAWLLVNSVHPQRAEAIQAWTRARFQIPLASLGGKALEAEGNRPGRFVGDEHLLLESKSRIELWALGRSGALTLERGFSLPFGSRFFFRNDPGVCDVYRPSGGGGTKGLLLRERRPEDLQAGRGLLKTLGDVDIPPDVAWLTVGRQGPDMLVALVQDDGPRVGVVRIAAKSGAMRLVLNESMPFEVTHASFSPQGTHVAIAFAKPDRTCRLRLYALESAEKLWECSVPWLSSAVAFSPDGSRLAVGTASEIVLLFETLGAGQPERLRGEETGRAPVSYASHSSVVQALAFTPDGTTLVSVCAPVLGETRKEKRNELRCWEAASGKELTARRLLDLPFRPNWVSLSSSGRWLAAGGPTRVELREWTPSPPGGR